MGAGLEIERVWVLRSMPVVPEGAERWTIQQGYLPISDAPDFPEGRVRRIVRSDGSEVFRHTVKRGGGLIREETERPIDAVDFARLWPLTTGRRIEKTRYRVKDGPLVWELDQFHGLPLVMLEVELAEVAQRVDLPAWARELVVREVTEDARFRNAALAINGVPSEVQST